MSFSNVNAYSSYPKPSATPSRAPPPPPPTLIYSKIPELTPSAPPPPNPNLRPVQQRNPPPPNSKPARLPPMLPTKPKWCFSNAESFFCTFLKHWNLDARDHSNIIISDQKSSDVVNCCFIVVANFMKIPRDLSLRGYSLSTEGVFTQEKLG